MDIGSYNGSKVWIMIRGKSQESKGDGKDTTTNDKHNNIKQNNNNKNNNNNNINNNS